MDVKSMDKDNENVKYAVEKLEETRDVVRKYGRLVLPHVARLMLMSTFIEDALRMLLEYKAQKRFILSNWKVWGSVADTYIAVNMAGQLAGCFLILARIKAPVGCVMLYSLILLQVVAFDLYSVPLYLMRNLALIGAVTILLVDSLPSLRSLAASQLPEDMRRFRDRRTIMQLCGRVLLVFMFISLFTFDMSFPRILECIVGLSLLALIVIGYRTREAALVLTLWLLTLNFYLNAFWNLPPHHRKNFSAYKFEFFQTLSVTGGFLLMVTVGPGEISWDEMKKSK